MAGATMYDSGKCSFNQWAQQEPSPCGGVFMNKFLGEFDPEMSAEKANELLDHPGKITSSGQRDFVRGWNRAKKLHAKGR